MISDETKILILLLTASCNKEQCISYASWWKNWRRLCNIIGLGLFIQYYNVRLFTFSARYINMFYMWHFKWLLQSAISFFDCKRNSSNCGIRSVTHTNRCLSISVGVGIQLAFFLQYHCPLFTEEPNPKYWDIGARLADIAVHMVLSQLMDGKTHFKRTWNKYTPD